jgi:phenylpropionate dioxygenase-like ring-hydroxylating dioxygenase large terminal subunit
MTYLRNTWYVAARSEEVTDQLFPRTLLDVPVVLFRDSAGQVRALLDRCPHRFAPLSMGQLRDDDTIECRYHGLCFDLSGACVFNPHGKGHTPKAASVDRYPVTELHGYVWIWMGNAEAADPSLVPVLGAVPGPGALGTARGYLRTAANYELLTDNLMDLSHVGFLHGGGLGDASFGSGDVTVTTESDTVCQRIWVADRPPAPFYAAGLPDPTAHVDHWMDMRWHAPAIMLLDVGITAVGEPREAGAGGYALHVITPETATTSHYFWTIWRTYDLENAAMTEHATQAALFAFQQQDKPVIEAQQSRLGDQDFWAMKPVVLPTDAAAVLVRRQLAKLIASEPGA